MSVLALKPPSLIIARREWIIWSIVTASWAKFMITRSLTRPSLTSLNFSRFSALRKLGEDVLVPGDDVARVGGEGNVDDLLALKQLVEGELNQDARLADAFAARDHADVARLEAAFYGLLKEAHGTLCDKLLFQHMDSLSTKRQYKPKCPHRAKRGRK
jgi:hypothetical protein